MKHTLIALLVLASVSAPVLAENNKHSVGLQIGGGGLEYKSKGTDNQGVAKSYLYYNYQFTNYFSAEVALVGASDVDDWECSKNADDEYTCYSDDSDDFEIVADDFDFGSVVVAIRGDLPLSKHNSLYGKIGAEFYDYEFGLNREKTIKEDGTGLFAELGWQYRWDNGLGLNASYQFHNVGDLEMKGLNLGISYAF